jgi:hypothetical protein
MHITHICIQNSINVYICVLSHTNKKGRIYDPLLDSSHTSYAAILNGAVDCAITSGVIIKIASFITSLCCQNQSTPFREVTNLPHFLNNLLLEIVELEGVEPSSKHNPQ